MFLPTVSFLCSLSTTTTNGRPTDVYYDNVWPGKTPNWEESSGQEYGCNVLFQQGQLLVNIGSGIRSFPLDDDDEVVWYSVPFGGNDVPMPYIVTRKWTYLLEENVYIANHLRRRKDRNIEDPYWNEYYYWKEESKKVLHHLMVQD
jgi:hypothetical protein